MTVLSHVEIRKRANSHRKKPESPLASKPTDLGPLITTHMEASTETTSYRYVTLVGNGTRPPKAPYTVDRTVTLPGLTAMQQYQVSANKSAALNKALEKIKDQRINLAVSAAELKETIGMFLSGGKVIVKAYRACVKKERALRKAYEQWQRQRAGGNTRRKRREAKKREKTPQDLIAEISSLWLGFRYGIMPLVYDVQGALDELARAKEPKSKVHTIKTSSKWEHENESTNPAQNGYVGVLKYKDMLEVQHFVNISYTVESPRTAVQLGFTNGPLVLWELAPLSFVVDWFLNIGETLAAMDATVGTLFVSGTISEKASMRRVAQAGTVTRTGRMGDYQYFETKNVESAESYNKSYVRTVLTEFPSPQVYVSNNMTTKRYLDAFALLKVILFTK